MSYYNFEKINKNELCLAVCEQEIDRRHISFDDVERITGLKDNSRWGSDASRHKRNSILVQFKRLVMFDPSILNQFYLK